MNLGCKTKLYHSDRSIAIGFINRNTERRNPLLFAAVGTPGTAH